MANTITFDTLELAQNLINARFTNKQAKALTQFQKETISQSMDYDLKNEMHNMKSDLTLVKYMFGFVIGLLITLIMKFVFA